MKNLKLRNILFGGSTLLLILIIAFFVTATVRSENCVTNQQKEQYYMELEKCSVQLAREALENSGYRNCGIVITRVIDNDVRTYKMTIHHGKILELDSMERQQLTSAVKSLNFPSDLGEIEICFLEN